MVLDRYIFTGFTHLVCTALALKILLFILPWKISSCFLCASEVLMIAVVAKITFGFTKKYFLSEEITGLNKKAILITGCDHGFGNELAKKMYMKGFNVIACCLNAESDGAKKLKKDFPDQRMKILKMDVRIDEDVTNAEKEVKSFLTENSIILWAVVNNAGIFKGFTVEFTELQHFEDDISVNTIGVVRVTKKFLPLLRKFRGRVVNVASLAGRVPMGHMAPYSMSKFATVAFTECLRQEMLPWGVKVISIEPEFFSTPMSDEENHKNSVQKMFKSIDKDTKEEYGEGYLKALEKHLMLGSSITSPKTYKVMDALEKAMCLKYPDTVYKPSRNAVFSAIFCIWMITPSTIQDIVHSLFQRLKFTVPAVKYPDYES